MKEYRAVPLINPGPNGVCPLHFHKRICAALLIACVLAAAAGGAWANTNTYAFNTNTGCLNVNYPAYLSRHDIVYTVPNTNPIAGLTVGNGRVGEMVWSTNGMMMQVSGVDISEQTQYGAGWVNFYTGPGMDTNYSTFQQRLSLGSGILTTTYDSDRIITIVGSPNSELFGIHVVDNRAGVTNATVDLKLWSVSSESSPWNAVTTYADSTGVGLSRAQTEGNNFGYTLAATVDGTTFTSQTVDSLTVRLKITPAPAYTIWVACASRLNAPNHNSVTQAKTLLTSAKAAGYAATLSNCTNFWGNFWSNSFVNYLDTSLSSPDYLENIYYLSTYMIASGGYGNYPFHFINGVYRATQDTTKWSNAYWFWNQRDVYNFFLASGHPALLDTFNNLYFRNYNTLKTYTTNRFGIDGIMVPETMVWNGSPALTQFTSNILSSASEAAINMYLRYKYTQDAAYLTNVAYPFLREVAKFYSSQLAVNPTNGQYYEPYSNAHETYWGVTNAITDLAAVRSVFPMAIEASTLLNVDATRRAQWQNVLSNLVPYQSNGTSYLPCYPFPVPSENGENVACEIIWPYSTTGIGAPDYLMASNTWMVRPFPYGNVWANDAIQAARLGMGDAAYSGMVTMLNKYQAYSDGMTDNNNGVFEFLGVHVCAMNESLLQSYNDQIRVFPAIPTGVSYINKFTLLAKGGFLVSSERENYEIKYVGIKSLYGNTAVLINPWGTQQLQVRRAGDDAILGTFATSQISFATVSNTVYVVERTAKPLSSYTYEQLTGTPAQAGKLLDGTRCSLGLPTPPAPSPGILLSRKGWVASGSVNSSTAGNAIDGNESSRWTTGGAQVPGEWFQVDLGSPQTFYRLVLEATNSPSDYPRGYQVNISSDGVNWGSPVKVGLGSSAITIISLPPQTARYLRITQTGATTGNYWSIDEFNIYALPPIPAAPAGVGYTAFSTNQISLSWNASSGADTYNVKRSSSNGGPYTLLATGIVLTNYNDTGLSTATPYYYVVSAVNIGGESTNSPQINAATKPLLTPPPFALMPSSNSLALSWPADHRGWHLQVQTNSPAIGLTTNWSIVPGSDMVTNASVTPNPLNSAVFYRLVYP